MVTGRPAARIWTASALISASPGQCHPGLADAVRGLAAVLRWLTGPQQAKQAAHLFERRAPGLLYLAHGRHRPIRVPAHDALRALRLDHHDAQMVSHDVVQFAGDAQPLGDSGAASLVLLPGGCQLGPFGHDLQMRGARRELAADHQAHKAGPAGSEQDGNRRRGPKRRRAERHRDPQPDQHDYSGRGKRVCQPPAAIDCCAVRRDQYRDEGAAQRRPDRG
jgi:hypothetical protein